VNLHGLGINQSTFDPCLLYSNNPFSLVGLQTDDTLIVASKDFANKEQSEINKAAFLIKEREVLTIDKLIKFNRGLIQLYNKSVSLT
jgi:hypothetical protein